MYTQQESQFQKSLLAFCLHAVTKARSSFQRGFQLWKGQGHQKGNRRDSGVSCLKEGAFRQTGRFQIKPQQWNLFGVHSSCTGSLFLWWEKLLEFCAGHATGNGHHTHHIAANGIPCFLPHLQPCLCLSIAGFWMQ